MDVGGVLLMKIFLTFPGLSTASTQTLAGKQGGMNTFYCPTKSVQERPNLRCGMIPSPLQHLVWMMVIAQEEVSTDWKKPNLMCISWAGGKLLQHTYTEYMNFRQWN